ncbi:hypothetical protein MA16_Dca023045 [Dendrobium catenatum]|uniref:Uncharacterized protein n=1 Tax=Dendrobium catenatum TaxID=906689 RepID=A0A2I0WII3_9ASPA|nr:hypothetical protein MA16_Dca023045 [Dendrobium catenatum]
MGSSRASTMFIAAFFLFVLMEIAHGQKTTKTSSRWIDGKAIDQGIAYFLMLVAIDSTLVELWTSGGDLIEVRASGGGPAKVRASSGGSIEVRASSSGLVEVWASGGGLTEVRSLKWWPDGVTMLGTGPMKVRASSDGPKEVWGHKWWSGRATTSGGGPMEVRASNAGTIMRSDWTIKPILNRLVCIQGDALADLLRFVLIGQADVHIGLEDIIGLEERKRERKRESGSCEGELVRGFTRVASRIALLLLHLEFLVRGRVGRGKELASYCGSMPASGGSKKR